MPTDEEYREKAVKVYGEMGDVETYKHWPVHRGVSGAWVKVEVWVSDDEFKDDGQFGVGA